MKPKDDQFPATVRYFATLPYGDRITVRYFATKNRISPYVAVVGDWTNGDNSNLCRSIRAGVYLCSRPAIETERAADLVSTRFMFLYWKTVRDMLWSHKSPDLDYFYSRLIDAIRGKKDFVKLAAKSVSKKESARRKQKVAEAKVIEQNKSRLSGYQMSLDIDMPSKNDNCYVRTLRS